LIGAASKRRLQAMTHEQRVAYFQKNIRIWTPERLARHLAWLKSDEASEKISAGQRDFWSRFTPKEKSVRVRHQLAGMSHEQKGDRVRKAWANLTPEARDERVRNARDSRLNSLTPESRKRMAESQTTEQRRESAKKTWAIRRERYGASGRKN
jgi:hypothetical protein